VPVGGRGAPALVSRGGKQALDWSRCRIVLWRESVIYFLFTDQYLKIEKKPIRD